MKPPRIPTPLEFARASRNARESFRGLDEVCKTTFARFRQAAPLFRFDLLPERESEFRAYVFFEKPLDIRACERNGISREIAEHVYAELERVGRGSRTEIKVAFEFDSDENVRKKFGGNYLNRLR